MEYISIILIAIVVVGLLALLYVTTYNQLQHFKTRIEISENSIDESLRKKYDYICAINSEIKNVIKDKDYLKEYIDLKNHRLTNYETDRKLIEAVNLITELIADHSKLDNKKVNNTLSEIKKLDQGLTASKNFFNKYTTELNNIIRKFPTNIISKRHGFKIKPYFDNKNMQDAIIDDFKL